MPKTPMNKVVRSPIVVVGRQRSGTTVIRKAIQGSGEYIDIGEIFHSDFYNYERGTIREGYFFFGYLTKRIAEEAHLIHPQYWQGEFRKFVEQCIVDNLKGIIIDMKYNSFDYVHSERSMPNCISNYQPLFELSDRGSAFIHVVRDNVLNAIVSERLAMKTGQWGVSPGQERIRAKIVLNPYTIATELTIETDARSYVDRVLAQYSKVVQLHYRDLFTRDGKFSRRFRDALEKVVPDCSIPATPGFQKQNDASLDEVLENHNEIREALAPTSFSWMLNGE